MAQRGGRGRWGNRTHHTAAAHPPPKQHAGNDNGSVGSSSYLMEQQQHQPHSPPPPPFGGLLPGRGRGFEQQQQQQQDSGVMMMMSRGRGGRGFRAGRGGYPPQRGGGEGGRSVESRGRGGRGRSSSFGSFPPGRGTFHGRTILMAHVNEPVVPEERFAEMASGPPHPGRGGREGRGRGGRFFDTGGGRAVPRGGRSFDGGRGRGRAGPGRIMPPPPPSAEGPEWGGRGDMGLDGGWHGRSPVPGGPPMDAPDRSRGSDWGHGRDRNWNSHSNPDMDATPPAEGTGGSDWMERDRNWNAHGDSGAPPPMERNEPRRPWGNGRPHGGGGSVARHPGPDPHAPPNSTAAQYGPAQDGLDDMGRRSRDGMGGTNRPDTGQNFPPTNKRGRPWMGPSPPNERHLRQTPEPNVPPPWQEGPYGPSSHPEGSLAGDPPRPSFPDQPPFHLNERGGPHVRPPRGGRGRGRGRVGRGRGRGGPPPYPSHSGRFDEPNQVPSYHRQGPPHHEMNQNRFQPHEPGPYGELGNEVYDDTREPPQSPHGMQRSPFGSYSAGSYGGPHGESERSPVPFVPSGEPRPSPGSFSALAVDRMPPFQDLSGHPNAHPPTQDARTDARRGSWQTGLAHDQPVEGPPRRRLPVEKSKTPTPPEPPKKTRTPEPSPSPSPPPSPVGPPSGVMVALARLADLESQMEFAFAKHQQIVLQRELIRAQTETLSDLPVGVDAFQEDLDKIVADENAEMEKEDEEGGLEAGEIPDEELAQ